MTNKNLTIGLLITLVIAICGMFFPRVAGMFGTISNGVDVTTTNFTSISSVNGISNGGVFTTAVRNAALTQATTTVCAIQSPAATSSLITGSILFTVSSTTASTVTLARATTAFATTTLLSTYAVAANAQATIIASSTGSGAGEATIFPPSTWFVVGMAGGTGTFSPTGVCDAVFQVLQ